MMRIERRAVAPLAAVLILLAAAWTARAATRAAAPEMAFVQSDPDSAAWVDSVLATLTLREKAAQMVWPTVLGDYVSSDSPQWERVRQQIVEEKVGGFTISVGSPLEIAVKLNAMQRMSETPLLIGADVEFGAGYRARGGYLLPNAIYLGGAVVFPPQMAVGATGDTSLAYAQGRVTALEARAIGIHIAYSPILDVNNNPANPVINTRSYGADPELAARLGAAFVRGVQDNGMIATGKHFPGHGDTGVNSHLALPVVTVSRARLDSVELVPFRAAERAGVGAIMTFHGSMPALDSSGVPGTLSRAVLTDLLREEMGFDGLIISDAMDMRGVLDEYGATEAAKRAVAAGADILIQPLDVAETIDAVVAGVSEGRYTEARLDTAVRRILGAKVRVGLDRGAMVDVGEARNVVDAAEHQDVANTVAERSITLVRDTGERIPLTSLDRAARILSVTLARRTDLAAGQTFNAELRRRFPRLVAHYVNADEPGNDFERLLPASDSADAVIVSSYVSHAWNATSAAAPTAFVEFVRGLLARGNDPIVVAMGNPYLLQQIPEVSTYVVAWGGFPVSQRAAARALSGVIPITGRLPIAIPPEAELWAGESRSAGATMPSGSQ